ncbi:hypothetical protein PPL_01712 [Heterostelium album PN500]|uniref:MOSC domain-containing protein n=1 Tax=Heterostelium pallidum (strain ATCC 26659 / Pp 5 / PN500) TaxID=670386 RepID=D3B096_HETP5|nr:hypothetical protein PPL_01712 [Heterostelium album PN500]EFA84720.1 hypothetical protein PPL_01712 [Heterostelium album PN500]|eukprot:XP_020436832.1 hypothetical protein PPL_01712 [Heterostelium album PN500]
MDQQKRLSQLENDRKVLLDFIYSQFSHAIPQNFNTAQHSNIDVNELVRSLKLVLSPKQLSPPTSSTTSSDTTPSTINNNNNNNASNSKGSSPPLNSNIGTIGIVPAHVQGAHQNLMSPTTIRIQQQQQQQQYQQPLPATPTATLIPSFTSPPAGAANPSSSASGSINFAEMHQQHSPKNQSSSHQNQPLPQQLQLQQQQQPPPQQSQQSHSPQHQQPSPNIVVPEEYGNLNKEQFHFSSYETYLLVNHFARPHGQPGNYEQEDSFRIQMEMSRVKHEAYLLMLSPPSNASSPPPHFHSVTYRLWLLRFFDMKRFDTFDSMIIWFRRQLYTVMSSIQNMLRDPFDDKSPPSSMLVVFRQLCYSLENYILAINPSATTDIEYQRLLGEIDRFLAPIWLLKMLSDIHTHKSEHIAMDIEIACSVYIQSRQMWTMLSSSSANGNASNAGNKPSESNFTSFIVSSVSCHYSRISKPFRPLTLDNFSEFIEALMPEITLDLKVYSKGFIRYHSSALAIALQEFCNLYTQDLGVVFDDVYFLSPMVLQSVQTASKFQIFLQDLHLLPPEKLPAVTKHVSSVVSAWCQNQEKFFNKWFENLFQVDKFQPLDKTIKHSSSVVDLFQMFYQAINTLSKMKGSLSTSFPGFIVTLSNMFNKFLIMYNQTIAEFTLCAQRQSLMPLSLNEKIKKGIRKSLSQSINSIHVNAPGSASKEPPPPTMIERAQKQTIQTLCVCLNNLDFIQSNVVEYIEHHSYNIADLKKQLSDLFIPVQSSIRSTSIALIDYIGAKVVFADCRVATVDNLYQAPLTRQPRVEEPLEQLNPHLKSIYSSTSTIERATDILTSVAKAFLQSLEYSMLYGGPTRIFNTGETQWIEADLESIKDYFLDRDEQGNSNGVPERTYDQIAGGITKVCHLLMDQPSEILVEHDSSKEVKLGAENASQIIRSGALEASTILAQGHVEASKSIAFSISELTSSLRYLGDTGKEAIDRCTDPINNLVQTARKSSIELNTSCSQFNRIISDTPRKFAVWSILPIFVVYILFASKVDQDLVIALLLENWQIFLATSILEAQHLVIRNNQRQHVWAMNGDLPSGPPNWLKMNNNLMYWVPVALGTATLVWAYKNNYLPGQKKSSDDQNKQSDSVIRIAKLIIYPSIELKRVNIDKLGFENDRRWMICVDGRFITQRTHPKLALIAPAIDGDVLVVRAPNMPELRVPMTSDSATSEVVVWKDTVKAHDSGDEAAEWLSKFLELQNVRLVQVSSEHRRHIKEKYAQVAFQHQPTPEEVERYQYAFCDASQVMILSQASIDDINARIDETRRAKSEPKQRPMDERRYRPNVLLVGTGAWEEDRWRTIRIGGNIIRQVDRTGRCKFTTIDPDSAVIDPYGDNEPLRTLNQYRVGKDKDKNVYVGILTVLDEHTGELCVGDRVDVIDKF